MHKFLDLDDWAKINSPWLMITKVPVLEARHQSVSQEVLALFPKGGYTFLTEAFIANFV